MSSSQGEVKLTLILRFAYVIHASESFISCFFFTAVGKNCGFEKIAMPWAQYLGNNGPPIGDLNKTIEDYWPRRSHFETVKKDFNAYLTPIPPYGEHHLTIALNKVKDFLRSLDKDFLGCTKENMMAIIDLIDKDRRWADYNTMDGLVFFRYSFIR